MEPGQVVYCYRLQAVGVTLNTGLATDNISIELFFGDGSRVTGKPEVIVPDSQLLVCRPPGRWPGQSMHARCREQSADAAVSYPRTTFDRRWLSIRRSRFPRFFVVQLQNFLRAD